MAQSLWILYEIACFCDKRLLILATSYNPRELYSKRFSLDLIKIINPFLINIPILYPLKTAENQKLSGVFKGYTMRTMAKDGLKFTCRIK